MENPVVAGRENRPGGRLQTDSADCKQEGMADYIYTMETRLTPDQMKAVNLVQDVARAVGVNLYVTGGTIRDTLTGFPIRDLDFTIQGNPLRLQKELERHGVTVIGADDDVKSLTVLFPGNLRGEIGMAHTATYEKPGKPPLITPASIGEDLRRRDFTVNAMALSLNPGSHGLFLDPANGSADIETKVIRILHNYAFLEDPVRLIRATRLAARFHWNLEERTQARYDSAKENNYIENIRSADIGSEIERLAYEDDPLHVLRALEKEGWLHILHPHWAVAKVDATGLAQLLKTKQQLADIGVQGDPAAAVLYFITRRLGEKDVADIRKLIPNKHLVQTWRELEDDAKELTKKLSGKDAATPSRAWKVLSEAHPETLMFLAATVKQQAVDQKIKNFFGKWRQLKDKLPFPEMAELHITPSLTEYPKIAEEAFRLMLDGRLRSHSEIMKFLKPFAPPPPAPPPAPPKRGRAAKAAEAAAAAKPAAPVGAKAAATVPKVAASAEKAAVKAPAKAVEAKGEKPPAKAETKVQGKKSVAKKKPGAHPAKKAAKKAGKRK
ncbi:MAG TPA: CCA tRNA nucleotidyltransferase [Terriglobales bacterium]|nr:CCA tRNA nucleotidyltransferase [Terriglobales bacterium]